MPDVTKRSGRICFRAPVMQICNSETSIKEMGCSLMKTTAIDLNPEDVEFLTKNTRYTKEEIYNWYKAFQKDCPNGKLTKEKFIEIYRMFFNEGNPEQFCSNVFRTFDEDGSGWINFREFLLAMGITTGNDVEAKLRFAFRIYDINNDGRIDTAEMAKIIRGLYEMLGSESQPTGEAGEENVDEARKVQFIFDRIDSNHDGKVSIEEFIKVCSEDHHLGKLLTAGATT